MARGTWQGSASWQASGAPDLCGLVGVAALVGVYAVAEIIVRLIWYIADLLGAVLVGAVAGLIWAVRALPAREAGAAELYAARFRALEEVAKPQELTQAAVPPPLEKHTHCHVHAGDHQRAAAIRQALPGARSEEP
jgi:hypothetical protein